MKPVAIVGMGSLMPGSQSVKDFWRNILDKKDFISDVPKEYWSKEDYYDPNPKAPDKTYCYRGGFMTPVDFDPTAFGIPPNVLKEIDSSQLLALICAKQVFEDADLAKENPDDISVVIGTSGGSKLLCESSGRLEFTKVQKAMKKANVPQEKIEEVLQYYREQFNDWKENTFPGLLPNVISGRIANRLNIGGENCIIDAACASALAAVGLGIHKLQSGESKIAIVGGADTMNGIPMFLCFSKTPALSPTQDCRPFSQDCDGTLIGEGFGMLALMLLEDAEKEGRKIYAVMKGIGSSSDGRYKSIYAPSSEGQTKALKRCYKAAGYSPEAIELLEAHGTGTKAGDKAEIEALEMIFPSEKEKNYCAIGSLKSQYGHTKGAAGAISLVKTVSALCNRIIPPTIKCENPIDMSETAFYISKDVRPWFKNHDKRRASVSAFGFGGANYHVTLEEYNGNTKKFTSLPFAIMPVSKKDLPAIKEKIANAYIDTQMRDYLVSHYQATSDSDRVVFVFDNLETLNKQIDAVLSNQNADGVYVEENVSKKVKLTKANDINLLDGMELAIYFDCFREAFEKDAMWKNIYPKPGQNSTIENNDAVIKCFNEALERLFNNFGIQFDDSAENVIDASDTSQINLKWFLSQLANYSKQVDYTYFSNEYDLQLNVLEKPKFSVKIAGYNYDKPVLGS